MNKETKIGLGSHSIRLAGIWKKQIIGKKKWLLNRGANMRSPLRVNKSVTRSVPALTRIGPDLQAFS